MIINVDEIKHIYGSAKYQDMRKQINGLSVLVANCCDMDDGSQPFYLYQPLMHTDQNALL